MSKTASTLKKLVEEKGSVHVANLLGEKTTRNVERWVRPGESIPKSKLGMVERILRLEGLLS